MNAVIYVPAHQVWGYFKRYEAELQTSLHSIAEWDECGIVVYLTAESGSPCFQVYADDSAIDEAVALDKESCEDMAEEIYDRYLTQKLFGILEGIGRKESDPDIEGMRDLVTEREDQLDIALSEFLEVVLENGELQENESATDPGEDLFQEIKDHILEYLAIDVGYCVYRPTIVTDESGEECIAEFPYLMYTDEG